MFAGHTDVVPSGPPDQWDTPPFEPTVENGVLYGRGAADMKSSLAAMVVALESLADDGFELNGTMSLLVTSDEEGDAVHGTRHAISVLTEENVRPDYCVIGEPSSSARLGDVVRCGRRGSLNGTLVVKGIQGHVAYPREADNPIHGVLAALQELTTTAWDSGNDYYPPTSLQCSNISAGTGATNVIPGQIEVWFNLRFNTEHTAESLQNEIASILDRHGLDYAIDWTLSGDPFLTKDGTLTTIVREVIREVSGLTTELSTDGGTSDGRFISPWGVPGDARVEVVELGPVNATIHKINEQIAVADLAPLAMLYRRIVERTLA